MPTSFTWYTAILTPFCSEFDEARAAHSHSSRGPLHPPQPPPPPLTLPLIFDEQGAIESAALGLTQLCAQLLAAGGAAGAEFRALPSAWLDELLEAAIGGEGTHLRRSAGLPAAILAVLHAEHAEGGAGDGGSGKQTGAGHLLERTVQRLLARAESEEDAAEASAEASAEAGRVHALNLLCQIYQDKAFGLAVLPHVGRGFRAAFGALTAPAWGTRNSATLLLSALLERALRNKRSRDEHAMGNALGIREFFGKAPELHPFLLAQLEKAASLATSVAPSAAAANSAGSNSAVASSAAAGSVPLALPVDLFAILLLLSKLLPSQTTAGSARVFDMDAFVPHVCACAALPAMRARAVAARALVPLVPPNRLRDFVHALARSLPGPPAVHNHNLLHGSLLQLQASLTRNCSIHPFRPHVSPWLSPRSVTVCCPPPPRHSSALRSIARPS